MLTHYEFRENSWVRSSSMLEAALKDSQKASLSILGKIVKKIWQGKVSKEYLEGRTQASFGHLGERLLVNDDMLTDLTEASMRKIHVLCVVHKGWFVQSCNNHQNTVRLLKFLSAGGDDETTVDGRRLGFEIVIKLSPEPIFTLSTYGCAVPIQKIIGYESDGVMKLSLHAIDNVLCLVNVTSPCLGQPISKEIPTSKFFKEPVLHSKRIQVYSKALGQDERLISSSCFLLTCPGCSSCQECAIQKKAQQLACDQKSDMLELDEEDSLDLQKIMQNTDKDMVPQNMKLLWDQQVKQLSAKSTRGFRWDARFAQHIFICSHTMYIHRNTSI